MHIELSKFERQSLGPVTLLRKRMTINLNVHPSDIKKRDIKSRINKIIILFKNTPHPALYPKSTPSKKIEAETFICEI